MLEADSRPLWQPPLLRLRLLTYLLFLVLNLFDACNTLLLIDNGGEEANPLMRWAIEVHPNFFIAFKMALATLGPIPLLMYAGESRFAWIALKLLAAAYLLVGGLHLYLLLWSPIAL